MTSMPSTQYIWFSMDQSLKLCSSEYLHGSTMSTLTEHWTLTCYNLLALYIIPDISIKTQRMVHMT